MLLTNDSTDLPEIRDIFFLFIIIFKYELSKQ